MTAATIGRRQGQAGFSMIELLISMSIMLTVTGTIFSLVNPAQGAFRVQPEVTDMQHRLRVASALLSHNLMVAGAGMYVAADLADGGGPLIQFFPPIIPNRTGRVETDSTMPRDAVSLVRVPATVAQTATRSAITSSPARISVDATRSSCPAGHLRCGFDVGQTVVVFDDSGAADIFRITAAGGDQITLEVRGEAIAAPYAAGAFIAQAVTDTFYLNDQTSQLVHYDGWDTTTPLIDNVADLEFTYFGDPGGGGGAGPRCGVNPNRPRGGTLVELSPRELGSIDCVGRFDADLYRLRSIRVDIRLQASNEAMRGTDVPDYDMSFEVAPRNMNISR